MKIFLIGYMGSGKSTIGMRLAEKLKIQFIDFDKEIEKETGKSIEEIFDNDGEEKFRLIEHEQLKKLLNENNVVISLGGGTPCFYNNIELINQNGTSIYIEVDADVLVKRLLKSKTKRPLIREMNEVDLKYFIEANLEKRKRIYEQSQCTVKIKMQNIEAVVAEIEILLSKEKK